MKKIIKKYVKSIILLGILLLACDFLSAIPPYIVKQVVDIDFTKENIIQTILFFIIIYIFSPIVKFFFSLLTLLS